MPVSKITQPLAKLKKWEKNEKKIAPDRDRTCDSHFQEPVSTPLDQRAHFKCDKRNLEFQKSMHGLMHGLKM